MVRDHPVVDAAGAVRIGRGDMGRGLDQRPHQVGVVVVVLALQERADPLQPHAGVDRGFRKRLAGAVLELLELHEDEVPDLDEPVAVLVGAAGRPAPDMVAVIVEDFRAGAAGAGRTHHPEVVVRRNADDPLVRQAGGLLPDLRRLVIGVVDRDQQAVLRNPELLGDQVPGEGDRVVLEIVAEREVPEHLEEGVVARGIADVVEVVVLAARAHAFLAGGGAAVVAVLEPGEDVLELHHARVGEHQRRVVARHQGRAVDDGVAVLLEVIEEGGADLVQAGHVCGTLAVSDVRSADVAMRAQSVHTDRGSRMQKAPPKRGLAEGFRLVGRTRPQSSVSGSSLSAGMWKSSPCEARILSSIS